MMKAGDLLLITVLSPDELFPQKFIRTGLKFSAYCLGKHMPGPGEKLYVINNMKPGAVEQLKARLEVAKEEAGCSADEDVILKVENL